MKIRTALLTFFVCSTAYTNAGIFENLKNNQANSTNFFELRSLHMQAMINVKKKHAKIIDTLVADKNKLTSKQKLELENKEMLLDCTLLYINEQHSYFNEVVKAYGRYEAVDIEPLLNREKVLEIINMLNDKQFVCADHEDEIWRTYIHSSPLDSI